MEPAMNSIFAIAASGMSAATARLNVAAQNTAAAAWARPPTPDGSAPAPAPPPALGIVQFSLAAGGVGTSVQAQGADDPVMDIVGQMQALQAFKANVRVFEAGEKTLDAALDLKA
jgi:flagellar basal body rod protein FlgC